MTSDRTIWQQVLCKTGVWLAVEVWLNIIGLDNMADYCEFLFTQDLDLNLKNRRTVKITESTPQFCPKISNFCPLPGTITKLVDIQGNSDKSQAAIFKNKCQKLKEPCIKVMCLSVKIEYINEIDLQVF